MLFKNHLFSSTMKKEAKRLKKKKKNQGHNITGQACVVCQDEVCPVAHAEGSGTAWRSDAGIRFSC